MSNTSFLSSLDYIFLKTDEHLGNNIILLALGGSRAYGTNLPDSDYDVRGITLNTKRQILNVETDFGSVVDTATDTTIYSYMKMIALLTNCNPNTIEILGCKPEHYLYVSDLGQQILEHGNDFLSIRAIDTFGGYADAQYNRLEHGLLGNGDNDDKKLQMLRHSLERDIEAFGSKHKDVGINLKAELVSTDEFNKIYPNRVVSDNVSNEHILINGVINNTPVTDFKTIIGELHKIQSEYGNINKRNTKKTDVKLAKHMMHLIRLYLMGTDVNSGNGIITYREKEHDMLMDIRNGKYMTSDGKRVKESFYDLLSEIQSEYQYSVRNTVLPEKPNYRAITELSRQVYRRILD